MVALAAASAIGRVDIVRARRTATCVLELLERRVKHRATSTTSERAAVATRTASRLELPTRARGNTKMPAGGRG
jgi:hypothetical protein